MKAIICTHYGSPEVLQLREVPTPNPKAKQVRIKINATAVTASDCIVRGFSIPVWKPMGFMMGLAVGFKRPRQPILGIVFSGEIDSVGRDVNSFSIGDRVFGWDLFPNFGAYAEYKCISADGVLALMPDDLSYTDAAAIPFGGLLALYYLRKGNIQGSRNVMVYGASGAVGTSAVQLAKAYGARVTGVCSSTNLELVRSLGADKVLDYTRPNFMDQAESYDLVFDAVGKKKSANFHGEKLLTRNGNFISVDDGSPKISVEDLIFLNEQIEAGRLRAVIDRVYLLEQIVEAHRYVDLGHKKGNVVITVSH